MNINYILAMSDLHAGHAGGLACPDTEFDDFDKDQKPIRTPIALREIQEFIWNDLYVKWLEQIRDITTQKSQFGLKKEKHPMIVIVNGDVCHGNRYASEIDYAPIEDQVTIAADALKFIRRYLNVERYLLSFSTESHNFGPGTADKLVKAFVVDEGIDAMTVHHGLLDVQGVTVDFAHHGPNPGYRIWLKGNVPRFYARDIMLEELANKCDPPDIVLRSHFHEYSRERVMIGGYETEMIVTPPMSYITYYARQATKSRSRISIGMVLIEIIDGRVGRIIPFQEKLDVRTKIKI